MTNKNRSRKWTMVPCSDIQQNSDNTESLSEDDLDQFADLLMKMLSPKEMAGMRENKITNNLGRPCPTTGTYFLTEI